MYIPTIVIICMVCGAMGGTLGYYLTKKDRWHSQMKSGKEQVHDLIEVDDG